MSTSMIPGRDALRRLLDELAGEGTRALKARRGRAALAAGLERTWKWLPAVPVAVLLLQGLRALAGEPAVAPHWLTLIVLTLAVPGVPLIVAVLRARERFVDRRAAIGLYDAAADAEERLVCADELMDASGASGFVEAALEDAAAFVGRARAATLEPPAPARRRERVAALSGALTVVLILAILAIGGNPFLISTDDDLVGRPIDTAARPQAPRDEEPQIPRRDPADVTTAEGPQEHLAGEEPDARVATAPDRLPEEMRRKEGRSGSGRSSQAESSRGEGDARGSPTNQGQTSKKPQSKRRMKPVKKRAARPKAPPEEQEKTAGEESGSTTGRGSSRGSNKNPVTSDWKSKDQVTTEEEDDVEDDEEVEDEEVDSEARGGVQPNLRDRKPPVSRDLSIGFGNRPNPNANGRGGPSQPKKSRGTASLVLGVPIPDRVKGRPNPGKTKVTQERVEPRRENASAIDAQARAPREGPSGPLARPDITPWMRALVRDYFLGLRNESPGAPTPPVKEPPRR